MDVEFPDRPNYGRPEVISVLSVAKCNSGHFVAEYSVGKEDGRVVLGNARPMSRSAACELLSAVAGGSSIGEGLLPQKVLSISPTRIVWWEKAAVRSQFFRIGGKAASVKAPTPPLVFSYRPESGLSVAALTANRKPDARTKLYHAPFMNVYGNTLLCTGSVELPAGALIESMDACVEAFFSSYSSHVNHEGTLNLGKKGGVSTPKHLAFWRKLHREKATVFPKKALVPLGLNLESWVDQV